MSDTDDLGLQLAGVFVHSEQLAIVLAVVKKMADDNVDHTIVYYRDGGEWYSFETQKPIVSACYPSGEALEMALLSADGIVIRLREGDEIREVIDDSDDGPSELVIMRQITEIDGTQFVVGMARHAYRKARGASDWERIDQTCFVPRAQRTTSVGFYSVDGFSATDVYAVGYKGEIWTFDGARWTSRSSPTNVVLTNVVCDRANQQVVIAGLAGTILVGRDDRWHEVQQSETQADFWGAALHGGHVYLSNDDGVFRLKDRTLEAVTLSAEGPLTTSYLSAREGVMWSVGSHDVLVTKDGRRWQKIENP